MSDDMFFVPGSRALRRGRRKAPRSETCRPCLVWRQDGPDTKYPGVVMDMSPYGMRVRMIEVFAVGTRLQVQLMRDEEYRIPLRDAMPATVMRTQPEQEGFMDHGVQIIYKQLQRAEEQTTPKAGKRPASVTKPPMYTLDVTVGGEGRGKPAAGSGRSGRKRGQTENPGRR